MFIAISASMPVKKISTSVTRLCSKVIHQRLPAIGRMYRRMVDKRWQSRPVTIGDVKLCLPPAMINSDLSEREIILDEMQKADIFVDVGANVGLYTCLVAAIGKRVIAIEPLRQNLDVLSQNVSLNPALRSMIEILPVGVSDHAGSAAIYGFGSVASLNSTWNATANSHHETIALSTLDELIGNRFAGARLLIKIDVEGCELSVLRGAKQTLIRTPKPVWLVEIFKKVPTTGKLNSDFDKTFSIFNSCGYSVTPIDEKNFMLRAIAE
jgi:FkbM family methyltransferase